MIAEQNHDEHRSRFRDLKLADVVVAVLKEQPDLHGKEIEKRAKEGGYQSRSKHFQTMLDGTLRQDGRFDNIGGNRWRLKPGAMTSADARPANYPDKAEDKSKAL